MRYGTWIVNRRVSVYRDSLLEAQEIYLKYDRLIFFISLAKPEPEVEFNKISKWNLPKHNKDRILK